VPLGFLAWVAFVPLLEALDRRLSTGTSLRSVFGIGYAFAFVFYLLGIHWIARLSEVAITVPWLKYPAWVFAAGYLAVFGGLSAVLAGALVRMARLPLMVAFPAAFLFVEELRASGELGFPWFQPGYTQHAYVPVIQLASLGSVSLVTLWLLVINVLAWRAWRGTARARAALGAVLLLALPWAWGARVLDAAPPANGPPVALVQPNIPGEMKWSGKHQGEILDRILSLSARAAADTARPGIVIWPETATGTYLRREPGQAIAVLDFCRRAQVAIFTGLAEYSIGSDGVIHHFNAAGLFLPDGTMSPVYAKRHLVPFGERMPFQWLVPALGHVELGQAEWTPGVEPVLFTGGTGSFGCLVCFESIFPDLARDDVRRGATWLVNITNDEWFGRSTALYQHAAMAVFRAVENHVPIARCANTGLTILIDGHGRVRGRLPVWSEGVLVSRLSPAGPPTLYTRVGDWPGVLAALIVAIGLVVGVARALTRPQRAA
jgi:apolipoprotein N-acyltransferase